MLACLIVQCTQGAVSISYQTFPSYPLFDHLGSALAANSLFIEYWSADASLSGFNNADPLNPTLDEVLGAYSISTGPQIAGTIVRPSPDSYGTGANTYSPGYTYIAVFEMDYGAYSGSVAEGTYYGLGPISGNLTQQNPPPATPDDYGSTVSSINTTLQTVPEPASLALMLIGAGVVATRRLRKRA